MPDPFRRRPLLRYATALQFAALVPFVASIFATNHAAPLVITGVVLLVTALVTVIYHELTD